MIGKGNNETDLFVNRTRHGKSNFVHVRRTFIKAQKIQVKGKTGKAD